MATTAETMQPTETTEQPTPLTLAEMLEARRREREAKEAKEREARDAEARECLTNFRDAVAHYISPSLRVELGVTCEHDDPEAKHPSMRACHATFTFEGEEWTIRYRSDYAGTDWLLYSPREDLAGGRCYRTLPSHRSRKWDEAILDALAERQEERERERANAERIAEAKAQTAAETGEPAHPWPTAYTGVYQAMEHARTRGADVTVMTPDGTYTYHGATVHSYDEHTLLITAGEGTARAQRLIPWCRVDEIVLQPGPMVATDDIPF